MSARNVFYEELAKQGINVTNIEKIEIRKGKTFLVYLKNGIELKIKEPYLVKLAKIASSPEESLDSVYSREQLLKRLYGMQVIYKGLNKSFFEFAMDNAEKNEKELANEVEKLEKKFSLRDEEFREGLKIVNYKDIIERERFGISFDEYMKERENTTTQELLDELVERKF